MESSTLCHQFRIGSLVFFALTLAACGGGGGSGSSSGTPSPSVTGNSFAPATGPGDTMGYVPYSAGNKWFYNATTNDPTAPASSSFVNAYINGTKSVHGVTATVLTQQDSSTPAASLDSYYYLSPGGLSYVGNNDATDLITPQIVPYAQLLFPVQTGRISSVTGTNLPFGYDGIGNPITLNITQTIDNVSIEAVSVSAGSFSNAMKQVSTISGTAHDAALGQSIGIAGTATDWLVPDIGLVKQTSSATVDHHDDQHIAGTARLRRKRRDSWAGAAAPDRKQPGRGRLESAKSGSPRCGQRRHTFSCRERHRSERHFECGAYPCSNNG